MTGRTAGVWGLIARLLSGVATLATVTVVGGVVTFSAIRSTIGTGYDPEIQFVDVGGCLGTVIDGKPQPLTVGDTRFCRTSDAYPETIVEVARDAMRASWVACGGRFPVMDELPPRVRSTLHVALCGLDPLTVIMRLP